MNRKIFFTGVLPAIFTLTACGKYFYNAPPALPPYIHKIAVRPFANHTQQYGLEDKLTLAVQAEFNRDGRYQITNENQADGIVIGDITKYILEPLSYDTNHVPTEYKLSIIANVSFFDVVKSTTMWTEPEMRGELRYFVASSGFAGAMTEDDARQTIWDELARDIRTRTLEGLGGKKEAATPASPDAVPPKPLDNNPPALPSQRPPAPSPTANPY
jgi:hypothetical protein